MLHSLCVVSQIDTTLKAGWILDKFPPNFSQFASLQQTISEMLFVCLMDTTEEGRTEAALKEENPEKHDSFRNLNIEIRQTHTQSHMNLIPEHTLLKRMYEMDKESVDKAMKERLEAEQ